MIQPERIPPGPGQESVWDYPRPPRLEDSPAHIQIIFNGVVIADTRRAKRILETSHPPVYYIPPEDLRREYFVPVTRTTFCEWKGRAAYYDIQVNTRRAPAAAWSYPNPAGPYAGIRDYIAVYPGQMDACLVDGERVRAQPGDFYGGWITSAIVGPFKGEPGTRGW
jgi:uncharacterized protein (DUF427 family)